MTASCNRPHRCIRVFIFLDYELFAVEESLDHRKYLLCCTDAAELNPAHVHKTKTHTNSHAFEIIRARVAGQSHPEGPIVVALFIIIIIILKTFHVPTSPPSQIQKLAIFCPFIRLNPKFDIFWVGHKVEIASIEMF